MRQLGDHSQAEVGPVQRDHLLPHAVHRAPPGADAPGVRPVDEDVLVHRAGYLFVHQPGPRLLVVNLERTQSSAVHSLCQ